MIAHAKANYKFKGKECPQKQLEQFADCLKLADGDKIRNKVIKNNINVSVVVDIEFGIQENKD